MPRSRRDHRERKQFRKRRGHDGRDDVQKRRRETSEPPRQASGANYGRELRELLAGIGTPKPAPFKPDPFQLAAKRILTRR